MVNYCVKCKAIVVLKEFSIQARKRSKDIPPYIKSSKRWANPILWWFRRIQNHIQLKDLKRGFMGAAAMKEYLKHTYSPFGIRCGNCIPSSNSCEQSIWSHTQRGDSHLQILRYYYDAYMGYKTGSKTEWTNSYAQTTRRWLPRVRGWEEDKDGQGGQIHRTKETRRWVVGTQCNIQMVGYKAAHLTLI